MHMKFNEMSLKFWGTYVNGEQFEIGRNNLNTTGGKAEIAAPHME